MFVAVLAEAVPAVCGGVLTATAQVQRVASPDYNGFRWVPAWQTPDKLLRVSVGSYCPPPAPFSLRDTHTHTPAHTHLVCMYTLGVHWQSLHSCFLSNSVFAPPKIVFQRFPSFKSESGEIRACSSFIGNSRKVFHESPEASVAQKFWRMFQAVRAQPALHVGDYRSGGKSRDPHLHHAAGVWKHVLRRQRDRRRQYVLRASGRQTATLPLNLSNRIKGPLQSLHKII